MFTVYIPNVGDRNTRSKNSLPLKWDYLGTSPKMGKGGSSQSQNHSVVIKQVFPKGEFISDLFDHSKVIGFDPILVGYIYYRMYADITKLQNIKKSPKVTKLAQRNKLP